MLAFFRIALSAREQADSALESNWKVHKVLFPPGLQSEDALMFETQKTQFRESVF